MDLIGMSKDGYSRRKYMGLAGAMAAGGLAGCSGSGNNDGGGSGDSSDGGGGDSGSSGGEDTSSSGGGGSGITVWTQDITANKPETQQLISDAISGEVEFAEMRYDNIKQQFLTGASTGTPDVLEVTPNHRGDYVSAEHLEPITDRVEELDYADGYIGMDTMTYKDDIWALPHIGNGRGFVYRQDILEKYGFDVPEQWSDFVTIGSEITKNEDGMHGFTLTSESTNTRVLQEFLSFVFQRVDSIFDADGDGFTLNPSPEDFGVVFKEYFHDPFFATETPATDPNARGIGSLDHDISYTNGNYAAISTGPWIPGLASNSDNTNEEAMENYRNSAATHNPRVEGGEKGTYAEIKPIMMNTHSDSKEEAWQVQKAIASPDGISTFLEEDPGDIPAHEDVDWTVPESTDNPDWAGFQDVFATGKSYGFWSVSKVSTDLFDLVQEVIYGETDPMDAGQQLHDAWAEQASEI